MLTVTVFRSYKHRIDQSQMGASGSSGAHTTAQVLTEISTSVTQSTIQRYAQAATQAQLVSARNIKGDVSITNVSMKQGMAIDINRVTSSQTQSELQTALSNAIAGWAKSQGPAVMAALGGTAATASSNIKSIFKTSVDISTLQEEMLNSTQMQEVSAVDIDGSVVIANITLEQSASIIAKSMMESEAYATAIQKIANTIDQSAESKQTNPGSPLADVAMTWMWMIFGIVAVGGLVIIFVFKYFVAGGGVGALSNIAGQVIASETGVSVAPTPITTVHSVEL